MTTSTPTREYNVGFNMVGFSVDDPDQIATFDSVTEARDYLLELIANHCEEVEEAEDAESHSADCNPHTFTAVQGNTAMMEQARKELAGEQPPEGISVILADRTGMLWSYWLNAGE